MDTGVHNNMIGSPKLYANARCKQVKDCSESVVLIRKVDKKTQTFIYFSTQIFVFCFRITINVYIFKSLKSFQIKFTV